MPRLTHKTSDDKTRYLPNFKKTRRQINNKLGQLEDVEDMLNELTFYGKVVQYPNQIFDLQFVRIYKGTEGPTDIRIEFELKNGLGSVFYSIFYYGKHWALTREELL